MRLSFHGAAQTVTGSKHLIEIEKGPRILLDCGLFQGNGQENHKLNRTWGFDPASLDLLILSHAHIDHSGLIPRLVKEGFRGRIICTRATRDLCELLLTDSAHIQENDVTFVNKRRRKKGLPLYEALYEVEDVAPALALFETQRNDTWEEIAPGVSLCFTDAGHILGSAVVNLRIEENGQLKRLCFSGDVGRNEDAILKAPADYPEAEYLICESTYGNRLHAKQQDAKADLLRVIRETCLIRKGKLIIPAFSIDRTQEIVYLLDQMENEGDLPPIKVYVDSPLSVKATAVMKRHFDQYNASILDYMQEDADPFGFKRLHYITDVEDSKAINAEKGPSIIISASGMAEAGRIRHHIANNIENPNNTILLVGYCTPESLGGKLKAGDRSVRIFGEEFQVFAHVESLESYSAHADRDELIAFLKQHDPNGVKKLFLVHGEKDTQQEFKETLLLEGFKHIDIPAIGDFYDI